MAALRIKLLNGDLVQIAEEDVLGIWTDQNEGFHPMTRLYRISARDGMTGEFRMADNPGCEFLRRILPGVDPKES